MESYLLYGSYVLIDLTNTAAVERAARELDAWGDRARIETLTDDAAVMIIAPGVGATK